MESMKEDDDFKITLEAVLKIASELDNTMIEEGVVEMLNE